MTRLRLSGGRVIDPANGIDAIGDVWIAEGRIAAVGRAPDGFRAEREIDVAGRVVCPGLVDLAAHLREPGEEHKATIASETAAAAAGGITTLCCPPDTDPVIDTPAVATLIQQRARAAGRAHVLPLGALTQGLNGERIAEMGALKAAGCVGVSNARQPITNTLVLRQAMEYAATHDLTVFLHPEDPWLRNRGCVHEGQVGTRLGLPGIPEAAETAAVACHLALIRQVGVRAHFARLSTAEAVRMVARARFDGLPVSADVSAHHLHLTELDLGYFDSQCHVHPPLRTERDRDSLRKGLAVGTLTAVCSDHQPHDDDAKRGPFAETAPGISGLETLLPLSLRLVHDGVLPLAELIARLTSQPARLLGLDAGTLGAGAAADVCVFDPEAYWELEPGRMRSCGRNTPFAGWQLKGRVTLTLLGGAVVFERGG